MSYTKTTWTRGDTITAEKLNKIENGIEAASSGPTIYEFLLNESGTGDYYAEGPTGLTYDDFAGVWIQFNKSNGLDGTRPYVLFPVLRLEPDYDGEGHILYSTIGIWVSNPGDPPMYGQNVSYDPESGKLYIPD